MNTYSWEVSGAEFRNSPNPTTDEIAIMSQALGILISVGVPILECISTVIEMTPNARIRKMLFGTYCRARKEDCNPSAFLDFKEMLDSECIAVVIDVDKKVKLDDALLVYARYMGFKPGQISRQIGRSESLMLFTKNMARNLAETTFFASLWLSVNGTTETFRKEIEKIIDEVKVGFTISEAMAKRHTIFDRMYFNMVKAGEMKGNLLQSFKLLAES